MGSTDAVWITVILVVFLSLGIIIPFINQEFSPSTSVSSNSYSDFTSDEIDVWDILGTIFSMFFWTFGEVNFYIDLLILIPIRIFLGILIVRNLPNILGSGGSGGG